MPGMKAKGKDVQSYVDAIETGKRALVEALRKFVRREAPQLLEQIKWGNICWIGKGNVCWIIVYKDHVDFGFFNGTNLFLFREADYSAPAEVRFELPPGWTVTTPLRRLIPSISVLSRSTA